VGLLDAILNRKVISTPEVEVGPMPSESEESDSKEMITVNDIHDDVCRPQRPPVVFWNGS
jgi:hypothetical protein